MTRQKTFKRRVRERMTKTGESYASAREALIGAEPAGIHPETSALRFALADAGIEISEALALIITGGAGAACMSFYYAKEDFSHLHLSGWNPFQSSVRDGVQRLRLEADVHETGGAKTAERVLRERLDTGAVQIAWVDEGTLRGVPAEQGTAYHVIVVLGVEGDTARIYDRTPQTVPAERLAAARGRIRKDRNRLLAITGGEPDLERGVRAGLERCAHGPLNPPAPGMSLEGIARWADAWPKPFTEGEHRDGALRDMTTAIRRSGGGLLRNLQAQGLREAADVLAFPDLLGVAELTASLAREWEALAADHDDLVARVRALYAHEMAAYETLQALLL